MADMGVEDIDLDISNNLGADEEEGENADDKLRYNKLMGAVNSLGKKKKSVYHSYREEADFQSAEGKNKVDFKEILGTLKELKGTILKRQLASVQKRTRTLATPLQKPQADEIKRTIAYEQVNKDVSKWDQVVLQNRTADYLKFPQVQPNFRLKPTDEFIKKFTPSNPLELQIASLLHGSKNVLTKQSVLTPAEREAMLAMSLQEAQARRNELQKMRSLISYRESKLKRHSKIKSKKYHRHLKRHKMKQEMKIFDELKTKDPGAAAEKLKELDLLRIQERVTLRHKNTGKWAKQHALRRKYDKNSRDALMEQLQLSRDLTRKIIVHSSSEDEVEIPVKSKNIVEDLRTLPQQFISKSNPWLKNPLKMDTSVNKPPDQLSSKKEYNMENGDSTKVSDSVSKCLKPLVVENTLTKNNNIKDLDNDIDSEAPVKKIIENHTNKIKIVNKKSPKRKITNDLCKEDDKISDKQENKRIKKLKSRFAKKEKNEHKMVNRSTKQEVALKNVRNVMNLEEEEVDDSSEEMLTESLHRKRTLEDMDEMLNEDKERPISNLVVTVEMEQDSTPASIDPNKLIIKSHKIKTKRFVQMVEEEEEEQESEEEKKRMTIYEAFEDLDIVKNFQKEKKDIEEKDKPKDIDLLLPGWGSWTGLNIKPSEAKKQRFTIKAPPALPRKDKDMSHVILSTAKNTSLSKLQVNEIPAPYRSVATFEKAIRAPIGKTWNTETAVRAMTVPKISTLAGTVIPPIDPSRFSKEKEERKRSKKWKKYGKEKEERKQPSKKWKKDSKDKEERKQPSKKWKKGSKDKEERKKPFKTWKKDRQRFKK